MIVPTGSSVMHTSVPRHRPHRVWCHAHICIPTTTTVGASMLAMVAQTPRAFRQPTSSLTTIASMLAPTGFWCHAHICIPTTTTVGAGLPAMVAQTPRAFRQPTSSLTTIASKLAPTGFWCHAHICIPTTTTVGAGLPAMAACQAPKMLDVPASSRASSLLQVFGAMHTSAFQHPTTVGASMLAMVAQTPRAFRQPTSSLTTIATVRRARSYRVRRPFSPTKPKSCS